MSKKEGLPSVDTAQIYSGEERKSRADHDESPLPILDSLIFTQIHSGLLASSKRLGRKKVFSVEALFRFTVVRKEGRGPFFKDEKGKGLTRRIFVTKVKKALESQGMAVEGISGHSFRIGAATAATMNGASGEDIKALDRWKSREYKGYMRTGHRPQATSEHFLNEEAHENGVEDET